MANFASNERLVKVSMKFQAHIINIQKLNESGTNETDVITKALDAYRRTHNKKHNFGFMHCWPIVKEYPRFFDMEKITTPKLGKKRSPDLKIFFQLVQVWMKLG